MSSPFYNGAICSKYGKELILLDIGEHNSISNEGTLSSTKCLACGHIEYSNGYPKVRCEYCKKYMTKLTTNKDRPKYYRLECGCRQSIVQVQ